MVRIWSSTEGARKIESWGPGMTRQGRRRSGWRVSSVQGFQGGLPQGGPRVLVLYQEGFPAVFQAVCITIPGNSQQCNIEYKFPRRRQRGSWRPGIIPGAGMGWSWRPGVTPGRVVQEWSTRRRLDSREFPNSVARNKFPR